MNSKKIKLVAFLSFFLFSSITLFSQGPGDPGGGPGGGDPPVGTGVPLDGGSIALLVAGAAYGMKSLRKKKKA
jgi:hypothetical protein